MEEFDPKEGQRVEAQELAQGVGLLTRPYSDTAFYSSRASWVWGGIQWQVLLGYSLNKNLRNRPGALEQGPLGRARSTDADVVTSQSGGAGPRISSSPRESSALWCHGSLKQSDEVCESRLRICLSAIWLEYRPTIEMQLLKYWKGNQQYM